MCGAEAGRAWPRRKAVDFPSDAPERAAPAKPKAKRVDSAALLTINRRSQALGPRGARVAQLVEHATENRSVGGSIPPPGTTHFASE